jgi:hypothetical protein
MRSQSHPALNWLRSSAGAQFSAAIGRNALLREVAWICLRKQILSGRYPFTRCFFIRPLNAIFVGIPKVATTSLYDVLSEKAGLARELSPEGRHNLSGIPDVFVRKFPDFFVFSFVRNPWSRVLSCYRYMIEEPRRNGLPMRDVFQHRGRFHREVGFEEFCLAVSVTPDEQIDVHLKSQVHLLRASDGVWLPGFVGKLENLEADFAVVAQRLGIAVPKLPKRNATTSVGSGSGGCYSPAAREAIALRYKLDIETFGYEFPG